MHARQVHHLETTLSAVTFYISVPISNYIIFYTPKFLNSDHVKIKIQSQKNNNSKHQRLGSSSFIYPILHSEFEKWYNNHQSS